MKMTMMMMMTTMMMTMLMMAAVFVHSQGKKSGQNYTTKNYVRPTTTPCVCMAWFVQHVLPTPVSPLHKGTIIYKFFSTTFLPRYC